LKVPTGKNVEDDGPIHDKVGYDIAGRNLWAIKINKASGF
jgi:hypothetical protein